MATRSGSRLATRSAQYFQYSTYCRATLPYVPYVLLYSRSYSPVPSSHGTVGTVLDQEQTREDRGLSLYHRGEQRKGMDGFPGRRALTRSWSGRSPLDILREVGRISLITRRIAAILPWASLYHLSHDGRSSRIRPGPGIGCSGGILYCTVPLVPLHTGQDIYSKLRSQPSFRCRVNLISRVVQGRGPRAPVTLRRRLVWSGLVPGFPLRLLARAYGAGTVLCTLPKTHPQRPRRLNARLAAHEQRQHRTVYSTAADTLLGDVAPADLPDPYESELVHKPKVVVGDSGKHPDTTAAEPAHTTSTRADAAPPATTAPSGAPPETETVPAASSSPAATAPLAEHWGWNATLDRNNHALTLDQCSAAFPKLYHEIDRSAAYWNKKLDGRKMGEDQISLKWSTDGGLRAMIWEQQLYVISSHGLNHFGHWKERSMGTLHQIHRAIIASKEPVPNLEFSLKINDRIGLTDASPHTAIWAFSRDINDKPMDQVWLIPDFNFWNYPRVAGAFGDFQREAIEVGSGWLDKVNKLVWRGTIAFNPGIRDALLQAAQDKPWSDVHKVNEDTTDAEQAKFRITLPDHCKYRFAVHTEGTTWSGRLKYLLSCHSAIIIHPLTYYTHLYHLLNPSGDEQNYVPVKKDWSDLSETMDDLTANSDKAEKIANNAAAQLRDQYFTPAAQTCYWRQLFHTWASMSLDPDPYTYDAAADGKITKTWRGMTYEEYITWDKDVPKPKEKNS
nr:kdel motif-containing protein 1 [Quercus suber]